MDTTLTQQGVFAGITAYDILIGDYGIGFLFVALFITLLGNLARKYQRFNEAVDTIKDFDWKYWLMDNGVGLAIGFPVSWLCVRAIDELAPMLMNSDMMKALIPANTQISAPVMVLVVCIGFGWLIDKYVPSPSIEKLIDPNK